MRWRTSRDRDGCNVATPELSQSHDASNSEVAAASVPTASVETRLAPREAKAAGLVEASTLQGAGDDSDHYLAEQWLALEQLEEEQYEATSLAQLHFEASSSSDDALRRGAIGQQQASTGNRWGRQSLRPGPRPVEDDHMMTNSSPDTGHGRSDTSSTESGTATTASEGRRRAPEPNDDEGLDTEQRQSRHGGKRSEQRPSQRRARAQTQHPSWHAGGLYDLPLQCAETRHVRLDISEAEHPAAGELARPDPRNLRRSRRRAEKRGEPALALDDGNTGCVVLIREDCRLHDNPALHAAKEGCDWVVPLYVHDTDDPSPWPVRGAGLWWRHESLRHFEVSLRNLGNGIVYRRGNYIEHVVDVMLQTGARVLHLNRQLEPWHCRRDADIEAAIEALGLRVRTFKGMVASFEPWDVFDKHDRKRRKGFNDPVPTVKGRLSAPPAGLPSSLRLSELGYCKTGGRKIPPDFKQYNEHRRECLVAGTADPRVDDWAFEMRRWWRTGEQAALERLEEWLMDAAWGCYFPPGLHPKDDAGGRFRADKKWTAILSPYLRFGDLSPRYVLARCRETLSFENRRLFQKRVVWRDKAYAQLYHWPDSHTISIRPQYEHQIWSGTRLALRRWQRGRTGFPLVDAAMRQLWKVGWMCNHLRHVTAQFLIEHLDLSWKDGFAWYDYTLVDTDVAINAMMWQMGGHSGIGAWNFVMHPVFAGKKVDPEGTYVRTWLPELATLPVEYIHCPWEAPAGTRISANVLILGTYWQRVIEDLLEARRVHQRNVVKLRQLFPQFLSKSGLEILPTSSGRVLKMEVRDDIRENNPESLSLMMTADDPRSHQRRNIKHKGAHSGLIYDETKRFEAMYDAMF